VGNTKPGSKATMQIWRAGASREVSVTVGELGDEPVAGRSSRGGRGRKPAEPSPANRLGLVLLEPSAEQKRQLDIRHGLIVDEVREGSRGDLRQGDVILAFIQRGAQTEIRSVDQFNGLLAKVDKGSNITLLVRRGDMQTFVTIKGTE
ncbi:MAG: protease Do, partial [Rhodocyclaceae bacterium]|nr:protease Do [Rhodocyclaceae bacterium]